jgi:hypothetical protein
VAKSKADWCPAAGRRKTIFDGRVSPRINKVPINTAQQEAGLPASSIVRYINRPLSLLFSVVGAVVILEALGMFLLFLFPPQPVIKATIGLVSIWFF